MNLKTPRQIIQWYSDRFFCDGRMRTEMAQKNYRQLFAALHAIFVFGVFSLLFNYKIYQKSFIQLEPFVYYCAYLIIGAAGSMLASIISRLKTKNVIIKAIPYYYTYLSCLILCCYVFIGMKNCFSGIVGFACLGLVTIMCFQIEPVVFAVTLAAVDFVVYNTIHMRYGIAGIIDIWFLTILLIALSLLKRQSYKFELLRTRSLEENRDLMQNVITDQIEELHSQEEMLEVQHRTIIEIQNNTIISLSNLVENRDSDTGEHVRRTSAYVNLIALKAKVNGLYPEILTDDFIELATKAAPMHDIGKIVVPDHILKKPGKLTPEEFEEIKKHTTEGGRIIQEILGNNEDQASVQMTKDIATSHHERWDGTGYPAGLKGEEIPLAARIMAIADVFDALVSPRCYKQSFSIEKAMQIIREESGTHFDPKLAELFLSMEDDALAIMDRYKD